MALHVLGRRPDGYHDLDTLAVFADVADLVTAEPLDGDLDLLLDGPFAPELAGLGSLERNLVIRAARVIGDEAGRAALGLRLRLTKRLPVGGGLGGGSADAAATLRLLNRLWRLDLPTRRLLTLAAGLGADVPMCLLSGPVAARGKGDRLVALAGLPPLPLVLVNPRVPVSTAAVFAAIAPPYDRPLPALPPRFGAVGDVARWLRETRNGLESAARSIAPVIGSVQQSLAAAPGCLLARMSGSGSTCFGLFPFREAAEHAARTIAAAQPGWWVTAAATYTV